MTKQKSFYTALSKGVKNTFTFVKPSIYLYPKLYLKIQMYYLWIITRNFLTLKNLVRDLEKLFWNISVVIFFKLSNSQFWNVQMRNTIITHYNNLIGIYTWDTYFNPNKIKMHCFPIKFHLLSFVSYYKTNSVFYIQSRVFGYRL